MKPTQEQAIKMLMSDEVYQALDSESFYNEATGLYHNISEVLASLSVDVTGVTPVELENGRSSDKGEVYLDKQTMKGYYYDGSEWEFVRVYLTESGFLSNIYYDVKERGMC